MVGRAEDQFPLPSGVAGIDDLRDLLPAHQGPKGVKLFCLSLVQGKAPAVGDDGQVVPAPLGIAGVIDGSIRQPRQMAHTPTDDIAAADHVAFSLASGSQHLRQSHAHGGLFRDHEFLFGQSHSSLKMRQAAWNCTRPLAKR